MSVCLCLWPTLANQSSLSITHSIPHSFVHSNLGLVDSTSTTVFTFPCLIKTSILASEASFGAHSWLSTSSRLLGRITYPLHSHCRHAIYSRSNSRHFQPFIECRSIQSLETIFQHPTRKRCMRGLGHLDNNRRRAGTTSLRFNYQAEPIDSIDVSSSLSTSTKSMEAQQT